MGTAFLYGNGGGIDNLKFRVYSATSLPSSGKENDVCIITSTPISSWEAGAVDNPTWSMDAGFVYLTCDASDASQPNLLRKNALYLKLMRCWQYEKGTWSAKDAYQYRNGSWTQFSTAYKIYGISRDITASSPVWARTDDAAGKTATASVGTVAGRSDFDNCYPWSGIVRETLSTGDVMVKIPKFWFRRYREGNVEHIKIADKKADGFTLHPLFNHGGVESECAYVGAYKTSSNNKSAAGVAPQAAQTRATFRTNAKAKGTGWSLIDIAAVSAIQMLILVEFANNDVQAAIGRGYCDGNSSSIKTGSCNSVANLTGRPAGTDGKVDVVWRGIEGFWGNIWEWTDGVNFNNGEYYVCNDSSKYADDTATNYTKLSFTGAMNWSSSYISAEGLDTGNNPHVMLPSAAGSGSETTYQCDGCWSSTGWRAFLYSGGWHHGSIDGLFTADLSDDSSHSDASTGSRLLYIPQ